MKQIDAKMIDAACKLAQGMKVQEIAASAGVHERTVTRWMDRDDFVLIYDQFINKRIKRMLPKALDVVEDAMDDSSVWARLAGSQAVRSENARLTDINSQSGIMVSFQSTMPPPALPEQEIQQPLLPNST